MRSEGVKDVVKWMEQQIKAQRAVVAEARKRRGCITEISEFYDNIREREEACLQQMVAWKVSTEKYMRKLRHEEREAKAQ